MLRYLKLKKVFTVCIAAALLLAIACAALFIAFRNYDDPYHKIVAEAGFSEKSAQIGSVIFNYSEGPDNGPSLLLLHAQHMDWYSYSRVLPTLSASFHVFAVDYHGHGKTVAPAERLHANQIGSDLAGFIETVIGTPVYVAGNSSGGVLAAWLAANRSDLVMAAVLEDPPLFSSEYPRVLDTVADKSFAICYDFIRQDGEDDFLLYWIDRCRGFFKNYVGFDAAPILTASVKAYRNSNPGKAIEIMYLPVTVRLMIRGMAYYDPQIGAAFHDGSWNEGFDHAEALSRIRCPVLLLHANYEIREDGILDGAIDQEEADKIIALIPNAKYMRIDSAHVIHLDQPELYVQIIDDFLLAEHPRK